MNQPTTKKRLFQYLLLCCEANAMKLTGADETERSLFERGRTEMSTILNAVNGLSDPLERKVLTLRYLEGNLCRHKRWNDIADIIYGGHEERHMAAVYRLHNRALKSIEKRI